MDQIAWDVKAEWLRAASWQQSGSKEKNLKWKRSRKCNSSARRVVSRDEIDDSTFDDGRSPSPRDLVTAVTGSLEFPVLSPALAAASVSCLFPTATNGRPVLMDRLPRPTRRPTAVRLQAWPPWLHLLTREGPPSHKVGAKGGMMVGTVMNAGLNINQVVAACSLEARSWSLRCSRATFGHYLAGRWPRCIIALGSWSTLSKTKSCDYEHDTVGWKNDIVDWCVEAGSASDFIAALIWKNDW